MKGIDKSFPGVHALHDVDFSVAAGEILALVGENGAGKSTLIKILTGADRADAARSSSTDRSSRSEVRCTLKNWASARSIRK